MRVIQFCPDENPSSGVNFFCRELDAALNAGGSGVASVVVRGLDELAALPVGSERLVLHVHGLWLRAQHGAAAWARKRGVPVVWSTHGMTAPWSMRHKRWKKLPAWWLYQKRDLEGAAAIHCTTDLEVDWNRALGLTRTFVAPLGCSSKSEVRSSKSEVRSLKFEVGSGESKQRELARLKIDEWLAGVDEQTFAAALERLVEEKSSAGEYLFKSPEDRELAIMGAKQFFREFSQKIVTMSDGRCVYFAPDARAKGRNANNAISWAEYAFHAVSSGGAKVAGKDYHERWYNPHKVPAFAAIVGVLNDERCFVRLSRSAIQDAIVFDGAGFVGESLQVVTRLDEMGNMDANLSEVTFMTSGKGQKKPPRLVPLTEAVQTVVHHQITAGSYSSDAVIVANSGFSRKVTSSKSEVRSSKSEVRSSKSEVGGFTLLFVGRIYPVKGLANLIRAYALIAQNLKKTAYASVQPSTSNLQPAATLRLRLVGPDQAGHMAELVALCESLGLSYSLHREKSACEVEFVGEKHGAELEAEYEGCDALVLPSFTENFGGVVVDALAHGKPVIASRFTPWRELVEKGCGWWVDNAPESLAKTIEEAVFLPREKLTEIGERGRELVEAKYTWDAVVRTMVEQYRSLKYEV